MKAKSRFGWTDGLPGLGCVVCPVRRAISSILARGRGSWVQAFAPRTEGSCLIQAILAPIGLEPLSGLLSAGRASGYQCDPRHWAGRAVGTPVLRPRRKSNIGFTLIELLVVVTIIAVLAALLLPVLHRAKQTGYNAVCIGNLRQWGIASRMYQDAFNDNFVPDGHLPGEGLNHVFTWYGRLKPYAFSGPVLGGWHRGQLAYPSGVDVCPGYVRLPGASAVTADGGEITSGSYAYNVRGQTPWQNPGVGLTTVVGGPVDPVCPVRANDVVRPSDMIEIGDTLPEAIYDAANAGWGFPVPNTKWLFLGDASNEFKPGTVSWLAALIRNGVGAPTPPGFSQDPGHTGAENNRVTLNGIQRRHRGQWNMLFCDGHVESFNTRVMFEASRDETFMRWNRDHLPHR